MKLIPLLIVAMPLACGQIAALNQRTVTEKSVQKLIESGFEDVRDAPAALKNAAKAIVKIETPLGAGTGFFISNGKELMTNYHVVGDDSCTREGCYVKLSMDYQRGSEAKDPKEVYITPVRANELLDYAVFKIKDYTSPHHLSFQKTSSKNLKGKKVHFIGHPGGNLKKWSNGEVYDSQPNWFYFEALAIGGNSGSPILSNEGKVLGILHRGSGNLDDVAPSGIYATTIATPSEKLLSDKGSVENYKSIAELDSYLFDSDLLLAIRQNHVSKTELNADAEPNIYEYLKNSCENEMKNFDQSLPSASFSAFSDCLAILNWVECEDPSSSPERFQFCPQDEEKEAWIALIDQAITNLQSMGIVELHDLYGAYVPFESDVLSGLNSARDKLQEHIKSSKAELTPKLGSAWISLYGDTSTDLFGDVDLKEYFVNYRDIPAYYMHWSEISQAIIYLYYFEHLEADTAARIIHEILAQDKLSIAQLLKIEARAHDAKLLR